MSKYLVGSPQSADFLDMAQLESGLNAMLGDPKSDEHVGPDIQGARIALRVAVSKVVALVKDPTRTEVDKHAAAQKLAATAADKLGKVKTAIEQRSKHLEGEALRMADIEFGPKLERGAIQSEIRGWVREQAKTSEGLAAIREAMKENDDVAATLWHSPRFLLGLAESVHGTLRFEALESRKPQLFADISKSINLGKLAAKYEGAIRKVHTSFYNPEVAAQAAKRVEV
ncbi:hypothetical protein [Anaeromyxobacter sp. SG17]|uniref:hypothetical protein n=1 Tax=Anaeromyxobacter sp. SG17 TaxID=2925405 RepID=UPI001F579FAF|nr:hypothetical protein [Anaeromyxobacter sp. SG17]